MRTWGTRLARGRDYLAGARDRPARMLVLNLCCYGLFQAVAWAYLGAAILAQSRTAVALFCLNVALPPFFIWATYNSVLTAWQKLPPDDPADSAVPFIVVGGSAVLLWLGLR